MKKSNEDKSVVVGIKFNPDQAAIIERHKGLNSRSAFIKGCINFYLTHHRGQMPLPENYPNNKRSLNPSSQ